MTLSILLMLFPFLPYSLHTMLDLGFALSGPNVTATLFPVFMSSSKANKETFKVRILLLIIWLFPL